jgi:hypothetical protein
LAVDPEALAQLARLLGDDSLRSASAPAVQHAIDNRFERLVTGLLDEAMASDDVSDRDSAVDFLDRRLATFGALLSDEQHSRLRTAIRAKIEAW